MKGLYNPKCSLVFNVYIFRDPGILLVNRGKPQNLQIDIDSHGFLRLTVTDTEFQFWFSFIYNSPYDTRFPNFLISVTYTGCKLIGGSGG